MLDRERLSLTLRELAADLAASRRECRRQQAQIAALKAENARLLLSATLNPAGFEHQRALGASAPHKAHALRACPGPQLYSRERLSSAVLALARGGVALKSENTTLRRELARLRASEQRPSSVAIADGRG